MDGADSLPQDILTTVVSPFTGHRLSQADLQDLLTAVSGLARAQGYLFAKSSIPPQTLDGGVLRVRLDLGRIDEFRLEGVESEAVRRVLAPLRETTPTRALVERRLMLAADLPGVGLGRARYALEGDRGVLVVPVSQNRVQGWASVDNRGLKALGPLRGAVGLDVAQVLGTSDRLSLQALSTPAQPRELLALYGRYALQPPASGTELAVYGGYGRTRLGDRWRSFDPRGESHSVGISLTQPIVRGVSDSLWLSVQGDRVAVNERWAGALSRRDRITTVGVSVNGYTPVLGGRLRGGGGVTQGLLALGATRRGDPYASRFGAGSDFTLVNAWANWVGDIAGRFSARLAAAAQYASAPLPAVQQITIGGPNFGRGYDFSERMGDQGVLASAELRAKLAARSVGLLRGAQAYAFADAGHVRNRRTRFATGDLYSAGAGARLDLARNVEVQMEAAFPINAPRFDSGDKSPRLSLSLRGRF